MAGILQVCVTHSTSFYMMHMAVVVHTLAQVVVRQACMSATAPLVPLCSAASKQHAICSFGHALVTQLESIMQALQRDSAWCA